MNKKILMLTIVLLALSMIIISPVKAITKAPYWEEAQFGAPGTPGKQWMANGILHIADMPWSGSYNGTLGIGTMDVMYKHIMLNTETGEGISFATWVITIGENTMSGSANGKITGGLEGIAEGYFRGTHGTGAFEHIQKMGTYSANLTTGILEAEGVIIYH